MPNINPNALYKEIEKTIKGFKNPVYRTIMNIILKEHKEKFCQWPAAVRNHHEIPHGLLWHSYTMMKMAIAMKDVYPDRDIDFDLLIAGIICHDMGKIVEIQQSGLSSEFSLSGKLLGHISIMNAEIYRLAQANDLCDNEEITLLQHMVLASHGKMEFGSPVEPHLLEAEILSYLDNLDARIYRVDRELQPLTPGQSTPPLHALERRWFIKHKK